MSRAETLFNRPWEELQAEAWEVRRRHHPFSLTFAVPGAKRYTTEDYQNTPYRFASISVTGQQCQLNCEHCRARMLIGMQPAITPDDLIVLGHKLLSQGCEGALISGGADTTHNGSQHRNCKHRSCRPL